MTTHNIGIDLAVAHIRYNKVGEKKGKEESNKVTILKLTTF